MTNEELVEKIQAGIDVQSNMEMLYEQNKRIITKWALPYTKHVELADLMQEAYFGLDAAVKDFHPKGSAKFLTYAQFKIKLQLQRYYFNCGTTKRLPVHLYEAMAKYNKFIMDYASEYRENPTDEVVMQSLGITEKRLKVIQQAIYEAECISTEDAVPGTEGLTFGESIADETNVEDDIIDQIENKRADSDLWKSVDELPDKQKQIILERYQNNESLQDISKRMEISAERVRQYERTAFNVLRNMEKVQRAADYYGYGSAAYYQTGLYAFKNSGMSSTEKIALKHIEYDERKVKLQTMLDDMVWEY
ncbi:MAG TPA: sigma-70 family RNA polymerase sigma factor [Clostridiales bacterium]|nr:sigma-70 family RNA polymerase sigma factor [Clostridiales bacterium]